jgi:quinol monooxygenase YgiN
MTRDLSFARHALSLAAVVLMLSPRPGLAQSSVLVDVRTLCQPWEIHNGTPQEQACFKELPATVRREGRILTLGLLDAKTKTFSDTKECDAPDQEAGCVKYRLVGHIGDRQFIVFVAPYECAYVLLVNRRTGAETKLGGWPILSPNKKRFVVIDPNDVGNCGPNDAIAIYSLTSDAPRLEWQFTPEGFEQFDVDAWNGENRVRLSTIGPNGKPAAADLMLTAQGWQLKRRREFGRSGRAGSLQCRHVANPACRGSPRRRATPALITVDRAGAHFVHHSDRSPLPGASAGSSTSFGLGRNSRPA